MISLILSRECLDALHAYVFQRCPRALENPEFLPGLVVVVEEEVVAALRAGRWKALRNVGEPCKN